MRFVDIHNPRTWDWQDKPASISETEVVTLTCPHAEDRRCEFNVRVHGGSADFTLKEHLAKSCPLRTDVPGYEEAKARKRGFEELVPPEPKERTILEEAGELVDGPREAHYGHPYEDFSRAIGAFNALFADFLSQPLEVRHWPLIMQLVKLSREINEPKRDNWVDGAGYWRTLEKVMERQANGRRD